MKSSLKSVDWLAPTTNNVQSLIETFRQWSTYPAVWDCPSPGLSSSHGGLPPPRNCPSGDVSYYNTGSGSSAAGKSELNH